MVGRQLHCGRAAIRAIPQRSAIRRRRRERRAAPVARERLLRRSRHQFPKAQRRGFPRASLASSDRRARRGHWQSRRPQRAATPAKSRAALGRMHHMQRMPTNRLRHPRHSLAPSLCRPGPRRYTHQHPWGSASPFSLATLLNQLRSDQVPEQERRRRIVFYPWLRFSFPWPGLLAWQDVSGGWRLGVALLRAIGPRTPGLESV